MGVTMLANSLQQDLMLKRTLISQVGLTGHQSEEVENHRVL